MATTHTGHVSRPRAALAERAARIRGGAESPFFELLRLADAKGPDVIRLGRGEPDIPTPPHIIAAAKDALDQGRTTYTNPAGIPELRAAIAEKFRRDNGLDYDPDREVLVTTGAQEAMAIVMQTLLDPGDEALLASPFYMAYETNIVLAGGVPVGVPTREDEDFQMWPAEIEQRITDRTKLLAVVSPSNPTAAALTRETLEGIAEVARRHEVGRSV